jgi:MFS family permease
MSRANVRLHSPAVRLASGAAHSDRTNPTVILLVLSLAGVAYSVLSSAVLPALPVIERSLHTSATGVTWLLTAFLVSASVGTSILGRLGDMYGKERLLLFALLGLAAGTLLAAVADSLAVLIAARAIQGSPGGSSRWPSQSFATSSLARGWPVRSVCCRRSLVLGPGWA